MMNKDILLKLEQLEKRMFDQDKKVNKNEEDVHIILKH